MTLVSTKTLSAFIYFCNTKVVDFLRGVSTPLLNLYLAYNTTPLFAMVRSMVGPVLRYSNRDL